MAYHTVLWNWQASLLNFCICNVHLEICCVASILPLSLLANCVYEKNIKEICSVQDNFPNIAEEQFCQYLTHLQVA